MSKVSFNPGFKGRFLNPDLVQKAAKNTKKAYINLVCQNGNVRLNQEMLAPFQKQADGIIAYLNELAAKLPKDLDLVLTKDWTVKGKRLSLDVVGPLGKTEFMGSADVYREYNIPGGVFHKKINLNTVEKAIAPLKDNQGRYSQLWPKSNIKTEDRIVENYITFIGERISREISGGNTRNAQGKIDAWVNFANRHDYNKVQSTGEILNLELAHSKELEHIKKANKKFRFKNIFGIN